MSITDIHGFNCSDLLPYVLDDDGRLQPTASYQCLSQKILQSFDPDQSSLTTWTTTKVKQYPALNQFLLMRSQPWPICKLVNLNSA